MNDPTLPTSATLSHLVDDPIYEEEEPYEIWADDLPVNVARTNVKLEIIPYCPLTDVRSIDEKPQLEKFGFEWMHQDFPHHAGLHSSDCVDLKPREQQNVLDAYVASMSDFPQEQLKCFQVVCWDWRVRKSLLTKPQKFPTIYSLKDGSPDFMEKVVSAIASPQELLEAKSGKYRIRVLTLWRPLVDVVKTNPLVCCDTRTVKDTDLDVVQKVMDDTVEEGMYLKWNKDHRWYWQSDQTRDDVLVMTVWDSRRPTTKHVAVPHVTMVLPVPLSGAQPRESIELRYVVWNGTGQHLS
ncbi:hypothetical protein BU24DRAFT_415441 [Aaosphaeria arxii CBS 175.79]|uniref:Methyltransferase n=1 Tax=Aaosphaeria arxii CBS 175.79 TaxID=1450172 RepID=A0A6A5X7T4_9PLEO|nr:uncharacterized protein BU24DRAFT_415441 [Aaosphaeria arxii CBS 175.79]KAF2009095.1 hypothetical protein BU24DRAFT_415441 [Aaosphaeria arxii CBS 175.79]